jgi:hypothetical protein
MSHLTPCSLLPAPAHRVDFVKQYWNSVFTTFIEQYAAGLTPNPDILCNRFVKFGHLLQHAKALGADRLATGHYARVNCADGEVRPLHSQPSICFINLFTAPDSTDATPRCDQRPNVLSLPGAASRQ